jgi:recombination protein RecT
MSKNNLTTTTKVELEKPVKSQQTIEHLFAQYQTAFAIVAAQGLDVQRMMRVAIMAMSRSPQLLECTAISLLGAFMQAAQMGLDLGMGEAHLVPFKNKFTHQPEVQLIPDYKGLLKLVRNSGQVKDCWARLVYKGEKFRVIEGDNPKLTHEPDFSIERKSSQIVAAYTIVVWDDGRTTFEVISRDKIERAHKASASGDSGPWGTDYDEMALKTAIKHRSKILPRSDKLTQAIALDERAELGRPQNIELLKTGDHFLAAIGPDVSAQDQASGGPAIVLISGTQQGKFTAWLKQYGWSEPQARQMLKHELGAAIDVSLAAMNEVVCQIPDSRFESLIEILEKGPGGKIAPTGPAKPKEGPAKTATPEQANDNEGEKEITKEQYDDLWAMVSEKQIAQAVKTFAKEQLGYSKLPSIKQKDLMKVIEFANKCKVD